MTTDLTKPPAGRHRLIAAVIVGVLAGGLSGLFGVGGGILIVPGLVLLLKMPQRLAHGTSLTAVLPIAAASLVGYATSDKVDWPAALCISFGAVAGAVLGAALLRVLPQRALVLAFIATMAITAVRLVTDHSSALGRDDLTAVSVAGFVAVGLVAGTLAGLLGVGGGVVMIPAMVLLFGIPPAVAKGTSVAVIIPTSIMGTWRNRRHGNSDLKLAAIVGLAGVASAFAMSKVSVGLSDRTANLSFALLLFVVAARMAWDDWRQRSSRSASRQASQEDER